MWIKFLYVNLRKSFAAQKVGWEWAGPLPLSSDASCLIRVLSMLFTMKNPKYPLFFVVLSEAVAGQFKNRKCGMFYSSRWTYNCTKKILIIEILSKSGGGRHFWTEFRYCSTWINNRILLMTSNNKLFGYLN